MESGYEKSFWIYQGKLVSPRKYIDFLRNKGIPTKGMTAKEKVNKYCDGIFEIFFRLTTAIFDSDLSNCIWDDNKVQWI